MYTQRDKRRRRFVVRSRRSRSMRFLLFSVLILCVSVLLITFLAKANARGGGSLSVPVSFPGAVFSAITK